MEYTAFRRSITTVLFVLMGSSFSWGQTVNVRGGFLFDSVRVGDEVRFYLSAQYPRTEQVLFPDSSFNYAPFEFREKEYFETITTDTLSYDSVVYYLTAFEVDRLQHLQLPVFQVNAQDCTRYLSNADTIRLQQLIAALPDSLTKDLPIRATIGYEQVSPQVNFPLIIIVVGLLVMIAAIVWVVFGSQIQQYYKLKRMKRAHADFIMAFNRYVQERETISPPETEAAVSTWKKYMEQLNAKPYTKLTTRETLRLEKDEQLGRTLRTLDAAIYGSSREVKDSLEQLRGFADQRFNKKMEEVKHG